MGLIRRNNKEARGDRLISLLAKTEERLECISRKIFS
jgi:hypothetical protein